jgi:hypothetical protein
VLLYLNNVSEGGETIFPWLGLCIKPILGKLIYFDYSSNNPRIKIKSQHIGTPIISGEKWIATLWIREFPLDTRVSDEYFAQLKSVNLDLPPIVNTEFKLLVGPSTDERFIKLVLPANTDPGNTLVVGMTGGIDSSLLLYLLAALNSKQIIPYFIKPVIITSFFGSIDGMSIVDRPENANEMIEIIRSKVNGNILELSVVAGSKELPASSQIPAALYTYFTSPPARKSSKYKFLCVGDNELPGDDSLVPGGPTRLNLSEDWLINPFLHIKKYHIVDAIIKLGLDYLFEFTPKCICNCVTLEDPCSNWHCCERRWAFTVLNKHETGIKHFIKKENRS